MKLLITGGTGFLGRRTVSHFDAPGFRVLAPSHGELDITDREALRRWLRENKPDAVIHTAAVSDTGLCRKKPEWSNKVNVEGSMYLAEGCAEIGAKLLYCSSDQVYSGSCLKGPHRETEDLSPDNVYGSQKLLAEERCLEILPETVCLRLSWMYARKSFPGDHGHFLTTLQAALQDPDKPLTWPVYDCRGITDVDAVVDRLPAALNLPGGVYNFGSENDASTYETVKRVLMRLGITTALSRLVPNEEAFREHPRDLSMNLSKIREAGICFPTTAEGLLSVLKKEICL